MANEFIARNGLIAQNNSVITGSLNVTSNITGSRLFVSSSGTSTLRIQGSGSELVTVDGATGRLFTVSDDLSDSLFSVNTISGLPVIEAFATNDVNIGRYGTYPIKTTATGTLAVITGSMSGTLTGTASFATSASRAITASLALTASFVTPLIQNVIVTGSLAVTQNITGSRMFISASSNMNSGSTLTIYGSGSTQPVFTVQGSSGELFSITDSLSGSLFSVNDISGLPILEVFSDNTTLIGNYLDPMLITTAKVIQTNSGSFTVYSLPTASYDTAFFEYSVRSGSNARAGTIMAIQSGSSVNFTETTTTAFGTTTAISFVVIVTGSNMALTGSSTSGAWTTKCIIRGI